MEKTEQIIEYLSPASNRYVDTFLLEARTFFDNVLVGVRPVTDQEQDDWANAELPCGELAAVLYIAGADADQFRAIRSAWHFFKHGYRQHQADAIMGMN